MVILDNETRWNSQYQSISRALKVKERIQVFCNRYEHELGSNLLTSQDWTALEQLHTALWPFHDATNSLQADTSNGRQGSLWTWLPVMEGLLQMLEAQIAKFQTENDTTSALAMAHQRAWEKLREYYVETDKAHQLYAASTLLIPFLRLHYFDKNWTGKSMIKAKKTMQEQVHKHWIDNYKDQASPAAPRSITNRQPSLLERQIGREVIPDSGDAFLSYIYGAKTSCDQSESHILDFWDTADAPQALKQMAYDLIPIPATSTDVERVFSDTKWMIQARMAAMSDETIEIRECLNAWLKGGHIELQAI